ncbi:uncharacterized protein LOC122374491 [Amphibalanus amphitrite]|uniref:uncharacterized protein LOC122374491 n=1 Tax=Amphibalanus amphitrite TaxID=1232801 RepID=UPI001C91867B|nr:uncharacterized protein LOC122374491 [Amphibalanus amphitrite]
MGGTFPLIALLVVAVIVQYVVSATDCLTTNCELDARKECQTLAKSVFCNMKFRQIKQIHITEASFPRGVQKIRISGAETITIGEDAIAKLTSLKFFEITNVSTLILQTRSLARGNNSEQITVRIRAVKSLQIYSETVADWRGDSRIIVKDVDDCQMFQHSIAKAQFDSFILSRIQSMVIHKNVFGNNTQIHIISIMNIASLSVSKRAFIFNVTVDNLLFMDIGNLTMHSGAIAKNTRIQEARLINVKNLAIESTGIQAEIEKLRLDNVTMETCDQKALGGSIGSMSLSSSHIHRTRKKCVTAGNGMNKLIIESSRLNHIETSAIYGAVREVEIKNSTFGAIEKEGLQLNVAKFSIENSTIEEASKKAFAVLADSDITIRNCTIDTLQKDAFGSLKVTQGSDLAHHRIQLDNLHIKHPQHGSLLFDKNQRVIVHELKTDTPCECNITLTLGLDMSSEHTFWIQQPLCVIKGMLPTLGHYLQVFCTEPIITPPPANPITNPTNFLREGTKPQPPQIAGESTIQDQQTIPETSDQTSDDGSDQVRTGFTYTEILIPIICVVVLIAIVVMLALLVYRKRWQRRRISHTVEQYHSYQSLPDSRQMTRGFYQHVYHRPLPPTPPTEALEMHEHNQDDDTDGIYETVEAPYQEIAEFQQQMQDGGPATLSLASLAPSLCHYHRLNPTQHRHHPQCLKSTTHYDHLIHPP